MKPCAVEIWGGLFANFEVENMRCVAFGRVVSCRVVSCRVVSREVAFALNSV